MAVYIRNLSHGSPRMGDLLRATNSDGTVNYYLVGSPHNFDQCARYVSKHNLNLIIEPNSNQGKWVLCFFRPKELVPYFIDEQAFVNCELGYIEEKDYLRYINDDILLKGEFHSVTEAIETAVFTESIDETTEIRQDFSRFCSCVATTFTVFVFMVFFAMFL